MKVVLLIKNRLVLRVLQRSVGRVTTATMTLPDTTLFTQSVREALLRLEQGPGLLISGHLLEDDRFIGADVAFGLKQKNPEALALLYTTYPVSPFEQRGFDGRIAKETHADSLALVQYVAQVADGKDPRQLVRAFPSVTFFAGGES